MRSFIPAFLAVCGTSVSAAVLPSAIAPVVSVLPSAPALPLSAFPPNPFVTPIKSLDEALHKVFFNETESTPKAQPKVLLAVAAAATCSNPRVRYDWDTASTGTRNAFISAVKCLLNRAPSGKFAAAKNRYEDFVFLHQMNTPNVHGNAKFLVWHRYFVWTFEDVLRSECGFNNDLPWFDETKYAGHFSQSSIFSSTYFGGIAIGGNCVTDGQFAGLTLNIGPSTGNTPHCLSRNGDGSKTAFTAAQYVNACNARTSYADMAGCQEGGAHAQGHNGIGAVMQDVYASPGDPIFWLHHMFVDRNFRIWQNADASRKTSINGNDGGGNPLTMDTWVYMQGIRPDVQIKDIMDTTSTKLCYKYNY